MNELLKALIVVIMAVPFIYMFFDVVIDMTKKTYSILHLKARPVLVTLISKLF
jgi:hypothetical protein